MHTQQKMQSTKVQQPWLWFARVSVSITKSVCGHLTWLSHVTHCTQCLMRKNVHYMHRLPMPFGWQKRLIRYRLCVKNAVSTCHVACRYRQVAVAQLLFWFYFGDSLFYKASDLCRLATATSFIVNMFTTYVQYDLHEMRLVWHEFTCVLWSYYHVYPHTWLLLHKRLNLVMFVDEHM